MTNPDAMLVFVLTALTLGPPEGFLRPGILSPGRAARLIWPWEHPQASAGLRLRGRCG